MTAEPAAERTGSPRVEELVVVARKKLKPSELPPAERLRRYAALVVAAERYTLVHEILASDHYSTVPKVYQENYGINAHADSATVQKVLGNSLQKMQNLGQKVHSAAHTFWDALCFYQEHESSLPAGVKTRYPLSLLRQWNFDLHEFADFLCPHPFKLLTLDTATPDQKARFGHLLRNFTPEEEARLRDLHRPTPKEPVWKPLKKEHACFLWWARLMLDEGNWSEMANLAHVWHLTDIKDKKSEGKSPASLQRHVQRLRKQHPRIPEPFSFMPPTDRGLFTRG